MTKRGMIALIAALAMSTPTFARADLSIGAVCGDVFSGKSGAATQKLQYCQAAKSSQSAASTNGVLWKVWAGVATVCTTACVQSIMGNPINSMVCQGSNVAGAVTDAAMTRNFTQALSAIAMTGISMAMQNGASTAEGAAPKKDWGACLTAAQAGIQALTKNKTAGESAQSVQSNLKLAQQENGDGGSYGGGQNLPGSVDPTRPQGAPIGAAPRLGGATDAGGMIPSSGCAQAKQSGSFQSIISCATDNDSRLPELVKAPGFNDEFKKATGGDLADFVKNDSDQPAAKTLGALMGASLPAAQSEKLGQVVAQLDQAIDRDRGGEVYAGGSGGSRGSAGEKEPDLNAMMQGLFGQLMPPGGADKTPSGVRAVAFANARRGPASVAEDTHLSLFDRVTYRYYLVGKRVLPEGSTAR